MFEVEMTPNLLGIKISGTYDDLDQLYDAVWDLCLADGNPDSAARKATLDEQIMSERLLALCYDLRHAYMGSRNIELLPGDVSQDVADWQGIEVPDKRVVLSVEVLYPEAMYEHLVLDYLIDRRQRVEKVPVYRDKSSTMVMLYQSKLLEAVGKVASKGRFSNIRNSIARATLDIPMMYTQWVDILDCDYGAMTKKRRLESLATIVRDLVEYPLHDDYCRMKHDVDDYVKKQDRQYPGLRNEIRLNLAWPDEEDVPW